MEDIHYMEDIFMIYNIILLITYIILHIIQYNSNSFKGICIGNFENNNLYFIAINRYLAVNNNKNEFTP